MRGWRTELPRRHREGKNRRRLAPVVDPWALSVTMASSALVMTMDDGEAGSVALVATTTKTPSPIITEKKCPGNNFATK